MALNQHNLNAWKAQAEIDYFSHFIKAWIPFNAWYQHTYPTLKHESEIMTAIRTDGNVVRSRVLPLLQGGDNDALTFKGYLGLLHECLDRQRISSRRGDLSFRLCYVGENPRKTDNDTRRGITYTIERDTPSSNVGNNRLLCQLTNTNGQIYMFRQKKHDINELQAEVEFGNLSPEQRAQIVGRYINIAPDLMVDLLDTANNKQRVTVGLAQKGTVTTPTIRAGAYEFCDNPEYIFSGLLNILYDLRCQLFHGEIVPNKDHNAVYQPAYFILKRFLECL